MASTTRVPSGGEPTRDDLRTRKRDRARGSIQDAALDLFIEKGYHATTVEEIAGRAEVSRATFFRLFGSKAEVVFGSAGDDDLRRAILRRPAPEGDVLAALRGVREGWVPTLDPRRVARQTRAAATSPVLRGLSWDQFRRLQATMSGALAERRVLERPDHRCVMVAELILVALSDAVNLWVYEWNEQRPFTDAVARSLAVLGEVAEEFSLLPDEGRPTAPHVPTGLPAAVAEADPSQS